MYSNIPGIQILISLLKQYNIKHIVISPGTRNTPLVHSVECDDFFKCYSIVDERSAGFFALGLSEKLNVPVCVTCTAATATCNYMPSIKEAYERKIKLIALTADQDTYSTFHMGDQNINQINMYEGYVNYAVDVPKINNEKDYWYFNRCVNEAFLKLEENGPIQINFRMNYDLDELAVFPLDKIKKTRKIELYKDNINWSNLTDILKDKKIIVFCGSDYYNNQTTKKLILEFKSKTNSVILGDYYSNIIDKDVINPSILSDVYCNKDVDKLKPDIIIFIGSIIYAPIKNNNKLFTEGIETWQISEDGRVNDTFMNTNKLFMTNVETFFANINKYLTIENQNNKLFLEWKKNIEAVDLNELEFSHIYSIKKILEKIPDNSIIHMSVLDAIRLSNYFKIKSNISCFANIGADGIDGALSTFLGQAAQTENLSFLLIGDLSLMYDMNALYSKIPKNVRIFVINNYAGSEFHKNFGIKKIPTLNMHIAAGHNTDMKDVSSINDFIYISATNKNELKEGIEKFVSESDKPIIFEVFTDANKDANILKEKWEKNRMKFTPNNKKILKIISKKLNPNVKKKIKKLNKR